MTKNRVWIYGVTESGEVLETTWRNNDVTDEMLESIAKNWKQNKNCDHVYAMMDSKELKDSWLVYIKSRHLRNGLAQYAMFEFLDYLKSGDWELAA